MKRLTPQTLPDALAIIEQNDWSVVAFDTETNQLSWFGQRVQGISFTNGNVSVYLDIAKEPPLAEAARRMFEKAVFIIAHNITFDAKALLHLDIELYDCYWFDTMVAEHLLNEMAPLGLKGMAKHYLDVETTEYEEAAKQGIHTAAFYDYTLHDAEWTWQIFHIQKHRLQEEGMTDLMREVEGPFLKVITKMESDGILVDEKRVKKAIVKMRDDLVELETKALEALGEKYQLQMQLDGNMFVKSDFNIGSSMQLRDKLFDEFKLSSSKTTDKGNVALNKSVLMELKDAHPSIPHILDYRNVSKLHSAFFTPLLEHIDKDGRVRPRFNDCGTKTGRLSCSSPNLQQLSKEDKDKYGLRRCFIAPEGKTILTCDYSGQEIRICAHITQDQTMIRALQEGQDLHLATANQFFELGIPPEELVETHPEYPKHKKKHKQLRDKSKIINFGIAYGKGAQGFSQDFKIPLVEAEQILDRYFRQFPSVRAAIEDTKRTIIRTGEIKTITGRKRHFQKNEHGFYSNAAFREGFNFLIQGFAADMIRMAAIRTDRLTRLYPEWELKMIATVHDENVYEVRTEYAQDAAEEIKKAFENVLPEFSVPIVAEVGTGPNYGEAK